MIPRFLRFALLATLCSAPTAWTAWTASTASAQALMKIGLGGGIVRAMGDESDRFSTGHDGRGFLKLKLPALPLEPRLDVTFAHLPLDGAAIVLPQVNPPSRTTGYQDALSGMLELQIDLASRGPVTPYIVGGAGLGRLVTEARAGQFSSRHDVGSTAIAGGVGVLLHLGVIGAFAEAQYVRTRRNHGPGQVDTYEFEPVNFVPISAGLVL